MPTWRLYALLLVAAPFGALGAPWILLAITAATLALIATAFDWILAGDGRLITAHRVLPSDKLSLGAWNPVEVQLANPTHRRQRIELRDQPPRNFGLDQATPLFSARIPEQSDQTVAYHVRPPRRGDARFDELYIRIDGPLGLIRRTFSQRGTHQPVRVYPNLRELHRYELMLRRGLDLQPAGRPVRIAGASTEFERVRDYVQDDEFRRINWKATARRGQPMVNQFEAERSQNLVILLDTGRAMAALADPPSDLDDAPSLTKLDRAINAALLMAHVASQRGDRVALLAYADDVRAFIPPQRGRRALLATVHALYNLTSEPVEPDHARAFGFLAQRNLRRSLVVLFTDLSDRETSAALAAQVLRAARHHLVVCVTLADPNLRRPAQRRPEDAASLYEKMVAQQLLDDRATLLAQLAAHGVLTVDTDAESLHPRLIATYLQVKHRGRI